MTCTDCLGALYDVHKDLELLRKRVLADEITARERAHIEGEIAALERASDLLTRGAPGTAGAALRSLIGAFSAPRAPALVPLPDHCRKCGHPMSAHVWKSRVRDPLDGADGYGDGEPPCPR